MRNSPLLWHVVLVEKCFRYIASALHGASSSLPLKIKTDDLCPRTAAQGLL